MAYDIKDATYAEVYTRQYWEADWTYRPNIRCDVCTFASGPSVGSAIIWHRYGDTKDQGARHFALRTPLKIIDHYVRIRIINPAQDPPLDVAHTWYGFVKEEVVTRHDKTEGVQKWTCPDLSFALSREMIAHSVVRNYKTPLVNSEFKIIDRALPFNYSEGRSVGKPFVRGNLDDAETIPNPVFCRSFGLETFGAGSDFISAPASKLWKALDIIKYLLAFHPLDHLGDPGFRWKLVADNGFPNDLQWTPVINAERRTVKSIIDEILNRSRLIGWYTTANASPELHWFPMTDKLIEMGGIDLIHANSNIVELITAGEGFAKINVTIKHTTQHAYERVTVRGGRAGTTFTIDSISDYSDSGEPPQVEKAWTAKEQEEYEVGSFNDPKYADDWFTWEKQAATKIIRNQQHLKKVFSHYRFIDKWEGKGSGPAEYSLVMPRTVAPFVVDGHHKFGIVCNFWRPGLRMSRTLPLLEGVDYSGFLVQPPDGILRPVLQSFPPSGRPPAMAPLLYALDVSSQYSGEDKWLDMADPYRGAPTTGLSFGGGMSGISATVTPLEGDFGFAINVVDGGMGGGGNHALSFGEFNGTLLEDKQPEVSLAAGVRITLHCTTDAYCEASVDAFGNRVRQPGQRVLYIDAGPGYRLEFVAPGTVVGLTPEGHLITSSGGNLFDDRDRLLLIARLAFGWYSRPRMAVNAIYNYIDAIALQYRVGDFLKDAVDALGEPDIPPSVPASPASPQPTLDSVISQVEYNFKQGTATIISDFGELDAKQYLKK